MKPLKLIAVLAALSACTPRGADPELATWGGANVVGRYEQSGHIGYLELDADGTYECFVVNGMTAGGCATFVGAGVSEGSWALEGGSISFVPMAEPSDLVVKLSGASAVPSETGLVLTLDGVEHQLARYVPESKRSNSPMQSDSTWGRR